MILNKLLEKQIKKYLSPAMASEEGIQRFLEAVNASYDSFERDITLSAHAFRISEQEYAEINTRLKEEIRVKRLGIKNLKRTIMNIEDPSGNHGNLDMEEDNLIDALTYLNEQIAKRKKVEWELRRLSLVASINDNGVLFTDPAGIITWANEGFTRLTGYNSEEAIGKTPIELFKGPLTDREQLKAMVYAFNEGRNFSIEVIHYRKDRGWFWGHTTGQSITDESGNLIQYFAMIEDVTHKKQLENELIEAKVQAEESARAKDAFLTNMSHEIRTPMNAILNMGRQLNKTPLSGDQRLYLNTINSAAESLLVIINDILDISKIEAGKLTIEKISFRLKDVIGKVTTVMLYKAEEKGLTLSFQIDEAIPPVLKGDPYRLYQVLMNLVSNAVKFTPKGSVSIACNLKNKLEGQLFISIGVIDTGIGMDKEFQQHLFKKFLQEDKTIARKYGGSGLGMSISKQLVELMNGTIVVRSEKEVGTEVTIDIPFEEGSASELDRQEKEVTDANVLKEKRILLAEDNEMNRLVANMILENYGAKVFVVVNGAEAIEAVRTGKYDLVLMDMQMPVMDGLEATRTIREKMDPYIPIIAVTANAIKGENDKCMAAGMNDYISKPFEENDFIRVIARWLGKEIAVPAVDEKGNEATAAQKQTRDEIQAEQKYKEGKYYDLSQLEEIGRDNPAFVKKMVGLFLDQLPVDADNLLTAYAGEDFDKIRFIAHRSIPALASIGIGALKDDIREMEALAREKKPSLRLEELITKFGKIIGIVSAELKDLYGEERAIN